MFICFGDSHHTSIAPAINLINLLLKEVFGFDCSELCKLLSRYQETGKFFKLYRDHMSHMLRVYLVGICLIYKNESIHKILLEKYNTEKEIVRVWTITALSHDWGYVFEWGNPALLEHDKESLEALNKYCSDPIRMFFPESADRFLPKQKEEIIKENGIIFGSISSFSNIQDEENVINYFKSVEEYANTTNLGLQGSSLKTYYEFMRKYIVDKRDATYCDHGIVSAYIVLWLASTNKNIKGKISKSVLESEDKANQCIEKSQLTLNTAISAACAIALHNISIYSSDIQNKAYDEFKLTLNRFKININYNPLAYLLVFADSIQEWERPSYLSEYDQDFQAQDMHMLIKDSDVFLCFPTDSLALQKTGGSRFEKIEKSISSLLTPCPEVISLKEISMDEVFEKEKSTSLNKSIIAPKDINQEIIKQGINKAYELYRSGRRYANEANFELAINLQREAAKEFEKESMKTWQSRAIGRVAFSSFYYGIPEDNVAKDLEFACKLDKWQGTANYYWIIDHCLKTDTSKTIEYAFFSTLLNKLSELNCIDINLFYLSSDEKERYMLFRSALVLFFDQLVKREQAEQWPNWAMSDYPRLYLLRAEENPLTSINYLAMAEKCFQEMELTSYAAWTNCKKGLLKIQLDKNIINVDTTKVVDSLQQILKNGRNILQSPRKERHLIKFFLTIIEFFYILLRYSNSEIDSFDNCGYLLKSIETSEIYERENYYSSCKQLLDDAKKFKNKIAFTNRVLKSLSNFRNQLVWIENEKIKELIFMHMCEKK